MDESSSLKAAQPAVSIARGRFRWGVAILAIYALSFFLPVYGRERGSSGAAVFLACLLEREEIFFTWPAFFPNVAFGMGLIRLFSQSWSRARTWSWIAVVIAAFIPMAARPPLRDLGLGYWAWLGSMALLAAASWAKVR